MTNFKRHLSGLELTFIQSLENICSSSPDVTNLFIFGSLVQNANKHDVYSDLDIMILTKENQNLPINLSQFVSFFVSDDSPQWKEFNFVLNDFHCGNMIVSTEEYFKKVIEDNPFFWGSVISKKMENLVTKNNFFSNISKIKHLNIDLDMYISEMFINKFIYDFINLLRMKQRQEISKIYFYCNELIGSLKDLILKKMQYEKYLDYKKNPKTIHTILKDYEGGHFERYASSRQIKIMDMLYKMINLSQEEILELFDLIYKEVEDFTKLTNIDLNTQKLDIMRLYMASSFFKTSDFNDYLTQHETNVSLVQKLLSSFTDN